MKRTTLILAIATFTTGTIVSSCSSPEEKVENAESDVIKSNEDLEEAKEAYYKELTNYRIEMAARLAENEQSIADLKARIDSEKKETRADRKARIEELEEKNNEMKTKIDEYNDEDPTRWEKFKAEFNHDMKELGNGFKNLGKNNVE